MNEKPAQYTRAAEPGEEATIEWPDPLKPGDMRFALTPWGVLERNPETGEWKQARNLDDR